MRLPWQTLTLRRWLLLPLDRPLLLLLPHLLLLLFLSPRRAWGFQTVTWSWWDTRSSVPQRSSSRWNFLIMRLNLFLSLFFPLFLSMFSFLLLLMLSFPFPKHAPTLTPALTPVPTPAQTCVPTPNHDSFLTFDNANCPTLSMLLPCSSARSYPCSWACS